jgi:hypothetical protein
LLINGVRFQEVSCLWVTQDLMADSIHTFAGTRSSIRAKRSPPVLELKIYRIIAKPFSASSAYHLEPPGSACSGMNRGSFTRHPPQNLSSGGFNLPHFALPHNMGFDPSPETAASATVQLNSSRGRIGGVYATARSLPVRVEVVPSTNP